MAAVGPQQHGMEAQEDRPPRQVPRDPAVRGGRWVPGCARLLDHGPGGRWTTAREFLFSSVSPWSGADRLSVAARNDGRAERRGEDATTRYGDECSPVRHSIT